MPAHEIERPFATQQSSDWQNLQRRDWVNDRDRRAPHDAAPLAPPGIPKGSIAFLAGRGYAGEGDTPPGLPAEHGRLALPPA